jgi:subtilisin family serine protease
MGILPGAPIVSYGTNLTCSDTARGISELVDARVGVINASLVGTYPCVTEYVAVEQAIGEGVVIAAAAGNEYQDGNPVEYPAAFPHVLSVAAVSTTLESSGFSNANLGIDISAPGEAVPVAVPVAADTQDGSQDGVTTADGTSFASPMVAGAAAWIETARPGLTGGQVADVLRYGARDLQTKGWDRDTGWGLLSIPGALAAPRPPIDPGEPNDDMPFVNGTYFKGADVPVFAGRGTRSILATADSAEDPADVYRIRMPGHSALRAVVHPRYGNPDLYAYDAAARSLSAAHHVIDASAHRHGSERIELFNSARRTLTAYLDVEASPRGGQIDTGYKLTITRTRYGG